MSKEINSILAHASSAGSKSNAVKPILGAVIAFGVGTILSIPLKEVYVTYAFLGVTVLAGLAYLIMCIIFLFKNPDILRSEDYNLEKTALEKITLGDSSIGQTYKIEPNYKQKEHVIIYPKKDNQ